jgi:hypothetical protein
MLAEFRAHPLQFLIGCPVVAAVVIFLLRYALAFGRLAEESMGVRL